MAENPIPEHLRPHNFGRVREDGSKPVFPGDIPGVNEHFMANYQKRDFHKRSAELLANNTEITHLPWERGYASQYIFDCLTTIRSLEFLSIGLARFDDLSSIVNLTNLQCLSLDSTAAVTDLSPICQLSNLESLCLGLAKRITTLDAFSDNRLYKLKAFLFGSSTDSAITLESLAPLGDLKALEYLVICPVRTKDRSLGSVVELPRLKAFQYYKNIKLDARDLDALKSRGVEVTTF